MHFHVTKFRRWLWGINRMQTYWVLHLGRWDVIIFW